MEEMERHKVCPYCRCYIYGKKHPENCMVYIRNKALAKPGQPVAYYDECPMCYTKIQNVLEDHTCLTPRSQFGGLTALLVAMESLRSSARKKAQPQQLACKNGGEATTRLIAIVT